MRNSNEQTPFGIVDCSSNPWNLKPIVESIMRAQNWILDRLPENEKLIILLGERHNTHTHPILQREVIAALQQQERVTPNRRVAFGYEIAHNFLFRKIGRTLYDPHGVGAVTAFIETKHSNMHEVPVQNLFMHCLKKGISVSFNDIADYEENGKYYIDQNDPLSAHLITKYNPALLGKKIVRHSKLPSRHDQTGITLSNLAIVENAIAHIERTKSRIYIQHCGFNHALGKQGTYIKGIGKIFTGYRYNDSLAARFQERGYIVLPVILDYAPHDTKFPPKSGPMKNKSILVKNMACPTSADAPFNVVLNYINKRSDFTPD